MLDFENFRFLQDLAIPAVSALLTWAASFFFSVRKSRNDMKNAISQERQKFHIKMAEKLYDRRFETYKDLLDITQDLGKNRDAVTEHKTAFERLKSWQRTSGGYLLLSKWSHSAFNQLKESLRPEPEEKNRYSETQRKKIFHARNAFRGALRADFDLLHVGERKVSEEE